MKTRWKQMGVSAVTAVLVGLGANAQAAPSQGGDSAGAGAPSASAQQGQMQAPAQPMMRQQQRFGQPGMQQPRRQGQMQQRRHQGQQPQYQPPRQPQQYQQRGPKPPNQVPGARQMNPNGMGAQQQAPGANAPTMNRQRLQQARQSMDSLLKDAQEYYQKVLDNNPKLQKQIDQLESKAFDRMAELGYEDSQKHWNFLNKLQEQGKTSQDLEGKQRERYYVASGVLQEAMRELGQDEVFLEEIQPKAQKIEEKVAKKVRNHSDEAAKVMDKLTRLRQMRQPMAGSMAP